MKKADYSSVHEFGLDIATSISRLISDISEFKGVRISEPGSSDCYVGFENVYGLGNRVDLRQTAKSFSMQQSMYWGDRRNPVEFERGSLRKMRIRNIQKAVPDLAKCFFFNFNSFCSEHPCYVMNRFRGNFERVVRHRFSGGKGQTLDFKRGHHYNLKENTGSVYLDLFNYEIVLSFSNNESRLFLAQDFCLPSENNRLVERGLRKSLDLEIDENGRLTDEGLNCLAEECFDSFIEFYKKISRQ